MAELKIKVEDLLFKQYSSIANLPDEIKKLWIDSTRSTIFSSFDWFRILSNSSSIRDKRIRIYTVECRRSEGEPNLTLAVLPAYENRLNNCCTKSIFKRELKSLTSYYASLFSPIIHEVANQGLVLNSLIEGIAVSKPRWDVIVLEPLANDITFEELTKSLKAQGFCVYSYPIFWNWYLLLEGRGFDEYLQSVPKRVVNTIKRKRRKLDRELGCEIELYTDTADLLEVKRAYWHVYKRSWKPEEADTSFIDSLIDLAAQNRWLKMGVIYSKSMPIAAQLWLVVNDTAYIYKLAYDEYYKDYSPGSILMLYMFNHMIDIEKVDKIDFLTGNDKYKQDWMSHYCQRFGIVAYNKKTFLGLIYCCQEFVWRFLKTRVLMRK